VQKSSGAHFFMEIEFVFGRATVPPKKLILFLPAAFCRLAKSLNRFEQMGWLVGAVGIEPRSQLWGRFRSEHTLFIGGLLAFPRQGAFLGHIHTPELRLRIVWVNLLMIPRAALLLSRAPVVL
jgi:hypothetical protein